MSKQKKWIASEDYDDLVAEVANLKCLKGLMLEAIHDLIITGDDMKDMLNDPEVKDYTQVVYEWDMLTKKFKE